jgi:pyruvate formate lyase activating enzyme
MKVYHLVYEPSYKSADIHFWTECNLQCRACYTRFETLDFGLFDDPITHIAGKLAAEPPAKFLTVPEVMGKLQGLSIERAIFIGTEPALDPEMPTLAAALHREFSSFNIMLTNGLKIADMNDIDEVIFSIKAISPGLHRAYTGRGNHHILKNFVKLYESGKKMQAETVLVPGLIEAGEIEKVAEFIGRVTRDLTLRIDAYFPVPGCPWRAATRQEVEAAAKLAERYVNKVSILTLDMKRTGDKPVRIF